MKKDLIFAYLIHLSTHMWWDESSPAETWYRDPEWNENNNTDLSIWDGTIKYLGETKFNTVLIDVGDAVKYESHPEISAPDAWDKDFFKKKLDEIRALGMTPVPKLNFSAGHDTWLKDYRRMIATPTYYNVCADLIREVGELFDSPSLFHLGFDEETAEFQNYLEMASVRNEALWFHDLNFFAKECEKFGARAWIWSDYLWYKKDSFFKNMSKDIVQSNFYYEHWRDYPNRPLFHNIMDCYELLDKHGYDQIPTCSTDYNTDNSADTFAHCKKKLGEDHLLGFMTAPWKFCIPEAEYKLLSEAQYFYYGRKKHYPETL